MSMAKLRGRGIGAGMALGTAAIVRLVSGIPMRPDPPERLAALIASRRLTETPEIILVAEDYRTALAIAPTIAWAKVVGIAAVSAEANAPVAPYPVVVELPDLMSAAQDDMLILVDATRGIALADPDPVYLGQYTAEHDRIAPKQRLYLDDSHQPAQTLDGRTIQVIAFTDDNVEAVVESGPDALLVSLPLEFDPDIQRRNLFQLVDRAAGKPLFLAYNSFLPINSLVQAAERIDITLVVPPKAENDSLGADPDTAAQLIIALEQAVTECIEKNIVCAMPRIAADIVYRSLKAWPASNSEITELIEELANKGITRLIFHGMTAGQEALSRFENMASVASTHFMPLLFYVSELTLPFKQLQEGLALIIGAGVTGLLCWPDSVVQIKEIVQELSYAECREKLRNYLNDAEETA